MRIAHDFCIYTPTLILMLNNRFNINLGTNTVKA